MHIKTKSIEHSPKGFFSFYIVFIVIFKGTENHYCKLHLFNILRTC